MMILGACLAIWVCVLTILQQCYLFFLGILFLIFSFVKYETKRKNRCCYWQFSLSGLCLRFTIIIIVIDFHLLLFLIECRMLICCCCCCLIIHHFARVSRCLLAAAIAKPFLFAVYLFLWCYFFLLVLLLLLYRACFLFSIWKTEFSKVLIHFFLMLLFF